MEINNIYLPGEVISHIFRYLSITDIKHASLVCHCWHEAADDVLLWRNVKVCIFTRQVELSKILLNSIKRKQIQHVKFRPTCSATHIMQVCNKIGSNLFSLSLESCRCLGGPDSALVTNILKSCSCLRKLDVSGCRQLDMNLQYKWLSHSQTTLMNLDCLILNSCKNSIKAFFEVLRDCKFENLTTLGISGCKSDRAMWNLLPEGCPSLTSLDISRCDITDEELISLVANEKLNLVDLNLTACRQITSFGFDKLFQVQTSIRSLKLGCTEMTSAAIMRMVEFLKELKELELNSCRQLKVFGNAEFINQLEYLNLYSCYQVSSSTLIGCFSGNLKVTESTFDNCMKHLVLNGCSLLSDEALEKIALFLPKMEHLDIGSCLQITDKGLKAVVKYLTHLKVLRISWCSKITYVGISGVEETESTDKNEDIKDSAGKMNTRYKKRCHGLRDLKKLESLDLSHCSSLTDEGLVCLSDLTSLLELNLSMCVQMTDATLKVLAQSLPCLEIFSVSGCNNLSEEGLKIASANLRRLKFLNLSRCDCVTDASLLYIAKHCRSLTYLDLSMCSEVIDYGVDELESSLTQLASLHLRYSGVRTNEFLS